MARVTRLPAPAKLNLALAVVGKRPDGFHELRSVFARLDLADAVKVAPARALEVRNSAPVAGEDLAARAARVLAARVGREPGVFVQIRQRIPVAAGLGGGSSDAAAVLRALAGRWGVGDADLAAAAADVGSDVPFFVAGCAVAFVTGRGEHVRPLAAPVVPIDVVVVRPTLRLGTAEVFAELADADRGAAERHVDALVAAFEGGVVTPDLLRVHCANDLLAPAIRRCEAIASWREAAAARGVPLYLTGSGPTLFAIADDHADALRIARILGRAGLRARAYRCAL